MADTHRVLVKLRPQVALSATASRVNLRPLYDEAAVVPFATGAAPSWHLADFPKTPRRRGTRPTANSQIS
jgi:hypothetical protein